MAASSYLSLHGSFLANTLCGSIRREMSPV
jgi:hypothetical protein